MQISWIEACLLGAIIGYTGFASGMNFMLINYYQDKSYGMGYRIFLNLLKRLFSPIKIA